MQLEDSPHFPTATN